MGVAVAIYGKKEGVESFNFGIKSSTLKTFASANGLSFLPPNNIDLSNKELGQLIIKSTRMALDDIGTDKIEIYPKNTI